MTGTRLGFPIGKRWRKAAPYLVFIIGLSASLVANKLLHDEHQLRSISQVEALADQLANELRDIFSAKKQLLMGLRGLFDASDQVSRWDFEHYMTSVDMEGRFPGLYAIGWNLRVPHEELAEFERSVRSDKTMAPGGYPDFTVKPYSTASDHHVVTYLYPMTVNERFLGFDSGTDPELRLTLELARDNDGFVATSPVETADGHDATREFLLFLPVYDKPDPVSLEERRESYIGALSGYFRISDLLSQSIQDSFDSISIKDVTDVDLGDQHLMAGNNTGVPFHSRGDMADDGMEMKRRLWVGGREWEISVSMGLDFGSFDPDQHIHWVVMVLGLLISLLASLWINSLITAHEKTLRQAEMLTVELVKANENLKRSNNDLAQFAYVASHDLQTPVRNVDMTVTLLEDALTARMDPQVREYLDYLRESAVRMRKLVEDLLAYARVDRETLQLARVDLHSLAEGVVKRVFGSVKPDEEVSVVVDELPVVQGDPNQLDRLLTNLLTNAFKYRHRERSLEIRITASEEDRYWRICVSDNGIGIDAKYHDRVFEPFQRLHRHDETSGTGLGLGICRQIAECHDGRLFIESSNHTGTTIVFCLPTREVPGVSLRHAA